MPPIARLLCLLLAMAAFWPSMAAAQIQRCTTPGGGVAYTDRSCADIGGVNRVPREQAAEAAKARMGGGCARNLRDLVLIVTDALEAHDGNRLAAVYHFAGMSGSAAYSIMARLDTVAQRRLVGIAPVLSSPVVAVSDPTIATGASAALPSPYGTAAAGGSVLPPQSARRVPIGLRVEQIQENGITRANTFFGLHKYFGCWWLKG